MGAKLFTVLAALSLLLSLTAAALTVRSFWVQDEVSWSREDNDRLADAGDSVALLKGWLVVSSIRNQWFEKQRFELVKSWNLPPAGWTRMSAPVVDGGSWSRFGERAGEREILGIGHQSTTRTSHGCTTWRQTIILPPWLLLLPGLVLPALWLRGWWRRRFARRPGLCARCGYDLRATPGRCPECGASAPRGANAPGETTSAAAAHVKRSSGSPQFQLRV